MAITYDWAGVTSASNVSLAQAAPWQNLQVVRPSAIVGVAGNPITGGYSAKFTVLTKDDNGDPNSGNPRSEVYSGANGRGIIPLDVMAYHGWAFTPVSGNTRTWLNWFQLHGAVSGAQPCVQCKTDHSGGFYIRTNPDGTDRALAATTPYGKIVRVIVGLKPSLGSSGVMQVWISIDGSAYSQVVNYTGRVGFAATYPKGFLYGDAAGAGFPWVNISHKTVINEASFAAVETALGNVAPGGGGGGGGGGTPAPAVLPALPGDSPIVPAGFAPGTLWTTMGADIHRYNAYVMPEAGTISSIVAGIDGGGGGVGVQNLRAVLGDFLTTTPLSLSTGQPVTAGDVPDWVEFPLLTPQHVTAGQAITLGLQSGTVANVARYGHAVGAAASLQVSPDLYADGVESPWVVTSNDAKIMAIYAKYVADSGTGNPGTPGVRQYLVGGRGFVSGGRAFVSGGRESNGLGGFGA